MGFLSIVLFFIVVFPLVGKLTASQSIERPPMILIYCIYLFLVTGMIMSMMSFKRKEKPEMVKWIAFILNLILLTIIVAAIIYAITMNA